MVFSMGGGVQCYSGNIDHIPLLCALFGADRPSFDRGDVTIGRGRLFQSDDGLRQFAVVVMLVELPEHLFELACGTAGLMVLFMVNDLSLDKKGRDRYTKDASRPGGLVRGSVQR